MAALACALLILAPTSQRLAVKLAESRHQFRLAAHVSFVLFQNAIAPASKLNVKRIVPDRLWELLNRPPDVQIER